VIANDMVQLIDQPGRGKIRQMGIPVHLDRSRGRIKGPAPAPGQHTREILTNLGYAAGDIARMKKEKIVK